MGCIGVFLTDIFEKTKQVFSEAGWIANFRLFLESHIIGSRSDIC